MNFIRRMLRELMKQDVDASLPGYFDSVATLRFEKLITTVPATIMNLTEQHDLFQKQGLDTPSILGMLNSHRQTVIGSLNESYLLDDTAPTESLAAFILHVIKHELYDTGPAKVTEQYVNYVIRETREFAKKNPRNTILGTARRMRKKLYW